MMSAAVFLNIEGKGKEMTSMKRTSAKALFALALVVVMVLGLGAPAFAADTMVSNQIGRAHV